MNLIQFTSLCAVVANVQLGVASLLKSEAPFHLDVGRSFDAEGGSPPLLGLGLLRENVEGRMMNRVSGAIKVMGLDHHSHEPLKRVLFTSQAKCNDGSPAGFYYRLSQESRRWIVFLEGGWYCFNEKSCRTRWQTSKHLMTSKGWPQSRHVGGILSSDPTQNPHWWRSNHVYVPYCSSDCWSGTREGNKTLWSSGNDEILHEAFRSMTSQNIDTKNPPKFETLHFMGSVIVGEVVEHLVQLGLEDGHSLVLAGSSAGGVGVLLNLDRVQRHLTEINIKVTVKGVADSAWFLDNKPFAPMDCHDAQSCSPSHAMKLGQGLWESRLPTSCKTRTQDKPWECFLGYKILPTIQSSLFIFQWVFDEAQMQMDNVGKPVSKQQWNYIHSIGGRIRRSLNTLSAVFAPSCISHTSLTSRHWSSIKVKGVSLSDALNCWSKLKLENVSTLLESHNNLVSSSSVQTKSSNSTDSIEDVNKVSRIVKLPNTTRRRSNKNRHSKNKENKCRKCRRKKKGRKGSRKASYTEASDTMELAPNSTLRNMLSDSPGLAGPLNSKGFESVPVGLHEAVSSGTLLTQRKRDRKRRRRKQRKRERNRKRKHRKKGKQKKKKKKKRRREKTERLKPESSSGSSSSSSSSSTLLTSLKNKSRRRRRSSFPMDFNEDATQTLRYSTSSTKDGESRNEALCETHLIDECSWPHCNPTCPPLMNPYTGEEMSRIQLLKSFGLSMADLAVALGIDIETLKSMDNNEIFLILSP